IEYLDSQSTQSEFRYVNGRRFHNEEGVEYFLPNDEEEQDRLHLQHFLIRYIWQSNFSSPIQHLLTKPGTKILDIGCGAGSWSFDMASTYPSISVVGIDISAYQPTQIKPENFTFIKANVQDGIPFEDDTFDFVFQRYLIGGHPKEKWPIVINEMVRVLKPGGYLELCEPSAMCDAGPVTQQLCDAELEIMERKGLDVDLIQNLEKYAQNHGHLKNIKKELRRCHHGVKSNNIELSKVAINNLMSIYNLFKPVLVKELKISNDKFDELVKISEKELFELDSYFFLIRVYASKVVDNNIETKVCNSI
ncbi:S-adenosyl-L-methionine-dependent methyltransferase, partial [Gigaspora rosea]